VVVSASGARSLGTAQSFEVKPVPNLPPGTDPAAEAARRLSSASEELGRVNSTLSDSAPTPKTSPQPSPIALPTSGRGRPRPSRAERRRVP
jgi:hypothetical protein